MTHFTHDISSRISAVVLTLLFSTVAVLGAVAPAFTGPVASQATTTLANATGDSANSLA